MGRPGGVEDPWHARKHCVRDPGGPASALAHRSQGRTENPHRSTTVMHGCRESDSSIVPTKRPNNVSRREPTHTAEAVEGRELAKGKAVEQTRVRTQSRSVLQHALDRIRKAARRSTRPLTALWHHVYDVDRLREAYAGLNRDAAPGVDGQTWSAYGEDLEANLRDLSDRLKRGAYHAPPVERVYIPKPDGRQRPIGKPTVEDKIVQRATVAVLNAIYEGDFRGFSYGFRPGRNPHHALDAVTVGSEKRNVNWVLDADIREFFDAIDHEWLMQFVEHRIGDRRIARQMWKWLKRACLKR